jgi:hypothetical protein
MRDRTIWLATVMGRLSAFLFIFIILLTGLFFLGNIQEFMDSTQLMLLNLIDIISPIFLFAALSFTVMLVVEGIRLRRFFFGRFILTLLGILLVAALFIFSSFLNSWMA